MTYERIAKGSVSPRSDKRIEQKKNFEKIMAEIRTSTFRLDRVTGKRFILPPFKKS